MIHFVHSVDPEEGGVSSSVLDLNESLIKEGQESSIVTNPRLVKQMDFSDKIGIVAHGLWQWPSYLAKKAAIKNSLPYIIFPHGMMDPWFKKTYPLKHLKKQLYWCWRQASVIQGAGAVCFTTEEEKRLAQKTFWPYRCREIVTGLGVKEPPKIYKNKIEDLNKFPSLKGKKVLLYLGRFHPKKGVDLLINSWIRNIKENEILVLAGPLENENKYLENLQELSKKAENQILWTGMLKGDDKWSMLANADSLILPSHQENFGMVVAEAMAVGTPVYLTDKVNLWREVVSSGAATVASDNQAGIDALLVHWRDGKHMEMAKHTTDCFYKSLHIRQTARRLIAVFHELKEKSIPRKCE